MLSLFFIYLQKIFVAGTKCYSLRRFACSLMCGDRALQIHVRACEAIICNWWELEEFKTTYKLVFNRF